MRAFLPFDFEAESRSSIGCGKSTLLQTVLGESAISTGTITQTNGADASSIAYCSQSPFLINKSIRENILGISAFDAPWYAEVVHACCLQEDLESFPEQDKTQVGSKGISLSGGQKQRIVCSQLIEGDPGLTNRLCGIIDAGTSRVCEKENIPVGRCLIRT